MVAEIDKALDLIISAQKAVAKNDTIDTAQKLYQASLVLIQLRSVEFVKEELAKIMGQ